MEDPTKKIQSTGPSHFGKESDQENREQEMLHSSEVDSLLLFEGKNAEEGKGLGFGGWRERKVNGVERMNLARKG